MIDYCDNCGIESEVEESHGLILCDDCRELLYPVKINWNRVWTYKIWSKNPYDKYWTFRYTIYFRRNRYILKFKVSDFWFNKIRGYK